MENVLTQVIELTRSISSIGGNVCVGQLVYVNNEGQAFVDFPENRLGPVVARSLVSQLPDQVNEKFEKIPILLIFENGDPSLPIILGFIHQKLSSPARKEEVSFSLEKPKQIVLDGKKVILDAQEEIVLQCGKSSIVLRKDGRVVVKGTDIVSRASRLNKVKGASVAIN